MNICKKRYGKPRIELNVETQLVVVTWAKIYLPAPEESSSDFHTKS